jgi:hypothetical protein
MMYGNRCSKKNTQHWRSTYLKSTKQSCLSGVKVSDLGIGHKVRVLKHGRGDGFLRATKIRSTPSFGWEVKPEVPCCKILQHVKITCKHEQKYFARLNSISLARSSCFLPDGSADVIARELWWMNQEFSYVDIIIPPWFSMFIYHLGNKRWAHWWQQFRDIVSPHRHDHDHQYKTS